MDALGVRRQNAQVPWRGRVPQEIVTHWEGRDEGTTQLQTGEKPTADSLQQDQPESWGEVDEGRFWSSCCLIYIDYLMHQFWFIMISKTNYINIISNPQKDSTSSPQTPSTNAATHHLPQLSLSPPVIRQPSTALFVYAPSRSQVSRGSLGCPISTESARSESTHALWPAGK